MAHAIPFFKVGVLLVKQATKPMARALKARAVSSERLAKACAFLGNQWHIQTTRLNLMVQGHRVKGVKPLNDQEAVQSGAELISESFVLSVGVLALVAETRRSARAAAEKAAQKEQRRHAKQEALNQQLMHVTDLVRESITYQIVLKDAMERQTGKPLPPAPQVLHDLMKHEIMQPGGVKSAHLQVFAPKGDKEPQLALWQRVLPQISTNGITALIRYVGGQVDDVADDADLGDLDGDEDDGGVGGDDDE